eukprot:7223558-Pyramimonas_sp.AAC.1
MPPFVPPAAEQAEVKLWGRWPSQGENTASCSNVVFTDGSGFASSIPELRRCGWACVQLSLQ